MTFALPIAGSRLTFYPALLLALEPERNAIGVLRHSWRCASLDRDLGIEGLVRGARELPKLAEKACKKSS